MADQDEVIISNVGKDGVASEVTLQRLVSALEKTKGLDAKGKKNLEDLSKQAKKTKEQFTSFSDEIEKTTTIMEDVGNTLKKAFTLENFGKVLGFAAGTATNFGKELLRGSTELTDFTQHIPLIGGSLGVLNDYFQSSLDTFRQLSDSGAAFGNNMLAMRQAAAQSGLSLEQFAEIVATNASSMGLLGATTSDGAARFGKLSKTLRSQENGLLSMGFTIEGVNEGFASFINLQAMSGKLRGQSDRELIAGAQNYLTEVDRLAKVTGQSRKQIQEEINGRMQAANFNVLAARLQGDALENFTLNTQHTSSMLGQGMADVMTDLGDGVAQSDFGRRLAAVVPGLSDLAEANARGEISQEEYQRRLKALAPQIVAFADNLGAAGVQQLQGQAGFSEFMDSVAKARTYTQRLADANAAQVEQQKRSDVTKGLSEFSQNLLNVRTKLEDAFIRSGLADAIGTALVKFGDILVNVIDYLGNFAQKLADGEIFSALGGVLLDGVKAIFENPGTIAAVVGGIAALFAAKAVVGALAGAFKSTITNTVSGVAGKLFGGGGASPTAPTSKGGGKSGAGAAKMAGNAGKGIGNFVGQMGAGVMKGAAAGLKAFANPQVLVGATILAGTITVIGAGIAAAAWLTGKALPTFTEGLKSFEELDGAALSAAASGMIDLSLAMAAFGAGTAVAGLGSMIGGITEGIGKLFGAEDPIDKLVRFSQADIDAPKVKSNAEAMVAFSDAMAASAAGTAASGIGSMIGGITEGLGKLFGGEDPIDKLVRFAGYDVDVARVKSNSEALIAFQSAMAASSGDQKTAGLNSLVSGIAGGLASLFGEKSNPMEDVVKFASYTVDATKVKANAEALVAFSNAMGAAGVASAKSGAGSVVGAVADAVLGFFGAEKDPIPFKDIQEFAKHTIDVVGVKTAAEGVIAFTEAMSALSNVSIGGNLDLKSLDNIAFEAGEIMKTLMPQFWNDFTEGTDKSGGLDGMEQVIDNTVIPFLDGLKRLQDKAAELSGTTQDTSIFSSIFGSDSASEQLDLILNSAAKFNDVAVGMQAVGDVTGFESKLSLLNSLNAENLNNYATAMERLVDVLGDLNDVLSEDNKGVLGGGTGVAAADVIGNSGGSGMSSETADRLNTTLRSILTVLQESRDYHKDSAKALKNGDLQRGL